MAKKRAERAKAAPKASGGKVSNRTPKMTSGQILKSIRRRAGVTAEVLAKAMGRATPTGYSRYENDPAYRDRNEPIPYPIIEAISPQLVNRGSPPITFDELLEISDAKKLKNVMGRITEAIKAAPAREQTPTDDSEGGPSSGTDLLVVRFRAEKDVIGPFMGGPRHYGFAPITLNPGYPRAAQFAVKVGDDHAAGLGITSGSYVHCVEADSRRPTAGTPVLTSIPRGNNLFEILLVRSDQIPQGGNVCGIPIAKYSLI